MYNIYMVKQISKVEDLGNENNQKLFLAFANVFFNGNIQDAIVDLNLGVSELNKLENTGNEPLLVGDSPAEIQLRFAHT